MAPENVQTKRGLLELPQAVWAATNPANPFKAAIGIHWDPLGIVCVKDLAWMSCQHWNLNQSWRCMCFNYLHLNFIWVADLWTFRPWTSLAAAFGMVPRASATTSDTSWLKPPSVRDSTWQKALPQVVQFEQGQAPSCTGTSYPSACNRNLRNIIWNSIWKLTQPEKMHCGLWTTNSPNCDDEDDDKGVTSGHGNGDSMVIL